MIPPWHRSVGLCALLLAGCSSSSSSDVVVPPGADASAQEAQSKEAGESKEAQADASDDEATVAPDAPEDVAAAADAVVADQSSQPDAAPLFYKNVVLNEPGDPDCARFGSEYYVYLPDQVRKDGQPVGGRVIGFKSKDLVHWTSLGEVFSNVGEAYGGHQTIGLWAPEVFSHGGKYYLYYVNVMTGGANADVGNKDIVVIQSDNPADFHGGTGRKVLLDDEYAFIDPSPFEDPVTHDLYLVYKRRGTYGTGSEIRIRPLASPTAFNGTATTLIESQNVPGALSIVEHPMLWRQGNVFFLLFSRGQGDHDTYAIAYATANSVTGPYTQQGVLFKSDSNLSGNVNQKVIAPGASSIVRDGSGQTWMVYRQKQSADPGWGDRGVCIDPIEIKPAARSIEGTPTKGVLRPGPVPL